MRTTGWLLLLTCVACGDATSQPLERALADDGWHAGDAMMLAAAHDFHIKSAAFDVTENGLTRSITLVASDQNDVCRDLLARRQHRDERRLALVGIAGGSTPLTSQFTMMQPRSIPKLGAAMLMVPAFWELNQRCGNTAPRVVSGAMVVFNVDAEVANAAFSLQLGDGAKGVVSGAVLAKYCKGIRDIKRTTSYGACVD